MLAIPLQTILHSLDFSTFVYELLRLQFSSLIAAPVSDPEYLLVGQTPQNAFDICLEQVLFGSAEVCLVFISLINYSHHNSVLNTADCCKIISGVLHLSYCLFPTFLVIVAMFQLSVWHVEGPFPTTWGQSPRWRSRSSYNPSLALMVIEIKWVFVFLFA